MTRPNCIVLAERFPNIYESYILNQIEYLIQNGGEVSIVSGPALGKKFDERVESYGLLNKTYSYSFDSLSEWLRALKPFVSRDMRNGSPFKGLKAVLRSPAFRELSGKHKLKALIKSPVLGSKKSVDLIHSHRIYLASDNLFLADAIRRPMVVSFHGLQTTDLSRPFFLAEHETKCIFDRLKLITAGTEYAKSILVHYGCPVEKIRILPVGVDMDAFPFHPRSYSDSRKVVLLTVARLSREKGHEDVIAAVKAVNDKGWNIEYRIVGDGPWSARLRALVQKIGASEFVHFVGEKENEGLKEEYRNADIFILASTKDEHDLWYGETQGLVIQEAQASGNLVIATSVGGIPECVDSSDSVLLVPERNPAILAQALERLLESPEEWDPRQRAGREWVESRFSMRVLGRRLLDVYEEACS